MSESPWQDSQKPNRSPKSTPTIGLLMHGVGDPNNENIWAGAEAAAHQLGVNLIAFPGKALQSSRGFEFQANVLYDLVGAANIDGLVIWAGGLSFQIDAKKLAAFCERYRPLPLVSIGVTLPGIPSVVVDNYQGMREVVTHLVETHGYRRIAFIRGPENHQEANLRYRAYSDVLAEHGIPLDLDLVAPGNFRKSGGIAAIELLLGRRRINFEALVGASDSMVIAAMEALQARGIRVPDDVAVAGLNDEVESRVITPPLTTAPLLFYEQAQKALELVLTLLHGQTVPEETVLSTKILVRSSCGCLDPVVMRTATAMSLLGQPVPHQNFQAGAAARRDEIINAIKQSPETALLTPEDVELCLTAFSADLMGQTPGHFLSTLQKILRQAGSRGKVSAWQPAISILRHYILPDLTNREILSQAEELWQQARAMVAEAIRRAEVFRGLQEAQQSEILRNLGQELTATFGVPELMERIAEALPELAIPKGYLLLYENPQAPAEWARLVLAYERGRRIAVEHGGQRFPSRQLLPEALWPNEEPFSLVVEPLYFRETQLGLAIFEARARREVAYDTLRGQISNALHSTLLLEKRQQAEAALRREQLLLRNVIDSIPDLIFYKDQDSVYLGCNKAFEEFAGHSESELVGRTDTELFGPEVGDFFHEMDRKMMAEGQTRRNEEWVDYPDGRHRLLDTLKTPFFSSEGVVLGLIGISHDITEREHAREMLAKRATELAAVTQVGIAVSTILEPDKLLQEVVDLASNRFGLYHAHIYLLNQAGNTLMLAAGAGKVGRQMVAQGWSIPIEREDSLVVQAARTRQGVIVNDVQVDPNFLPNPLLPETRSEMAVPMIVGDQLLGVLDVQANTINHFTDEDVRVQTILAAQVAVSLQNTKLYEQSQVILTETQTLYDISARLNTASSLEEVLEVAASPGIMAGASSAGIWLFDTDDAGRPEWMEFATTWVREGSPVMPLGTRLRLTEFPSYNIWVNDTGLPSFVSNIESDKRVDSKLRAVFAQTGIQAMAFMPLTRGARWIGVAIISWQSPHEFTSGEQQLYKSIAAQTTVAIENRRLFAETQAALDEVQELNRRLIRQSWENIGDKVASTGYIFTEEGVAPADTEWLPIMTEAVELKMFTASDSTNGASPEQPNTLAIPLMLRDEVIGVIGIERPSDKAWSEDEVTAIHNLTEQVALALDAARLTRETERAAWRDQVISESTAKVWSSTEMEEVLRAAVAQLGDKLRATEVVIRLGQEDEILDSAAWLPQER